MMIRVFCPLHEWTGLNCITCGATRALLSLLQGDILTALQQNALLVISLPFAIYKLTALIINRVTRKPLLRPISLSKKAGIVLIIVAIAFMVVRNLPIPAARFLNP